MEKTDERVYIHTCINKELSERLRAYILKHFGKERASGIIIRRALSQYLDREESKCE